MAKQVYVVATVKPWNKMVFNEVISRYPGEWYLISKQKDLTASKIRTLNPKYIFFPHWHYIVSKEILDLSHCICFHETDLPYGRGGSPIQNLIARGHKKTVITAFKMIKEPDAGPVYIKRPLSLDGLAEEIYIRAAYIIAEMIKSIITKNLEPVEQLGEPTLFQRRKPSQSEMPVETVDLFKLFDHIRMLDAKGYPKAYFNFGVFRYEISNPVLKTGEIHANIRITKEDEKTDD